MQAKQTPLYLLQPLWNQPPPTGTLNVVVLGTTAGAVAFAVDRFEGVAEAVVAAPGPYLDALAYVVGTTVTPDGEPTLLTDPASLARHAHQASLRPGVLVSGVVVSGDLGQAPAACRLLLIDDSLSVRRLVSKAEPELPHNPELISGPAAASPAQGTASGSFTAAPATVTPASTATPPASVAPPEPASSALFTPAPTTVQAAALPTALHAGAEVPQITAISTSAEPSGVQASAAQTSAAQALVDTLTRKPGVLGARLQGGASTGVQLEFEGRTLLILPHGEAHLLVCLLADANSSMVRFAVHRCVAPVPV